MTLADLVVNSGLTRVLIIDDAYDTVPLAEDLQGVDLGALLKVLDAQPQAVRDQLGAVLETLHLDPDEFEEGLSEDSFVAKLWDLAEGQALADDASGILFDNYRQLQAQKKQQLQPLEVLLESDLNMAVERQGREVGALGDYDLVFVDLFLGVTDADSALEQAIVRVKRLIENLGEEQRPLVFVMSTKAGTELSGLASRLQAEASLLGCKFRTISKREFERALPQILEQLLRDRPNAQLIARWLDTWKASISSANGVFIDKLRSLDLSDYAYLRKFRLEAEGVGLGEYLRPVLQDFLSYCVEECESLGQRAKELDAIVFEPMPSAHFLPSPQVTEIGHARTFLNRKLIEVNGYQFDDVAHSLQLGDVIVRLPAKRGGYDFHLDGLEALVVITQACDVQQNNTDSFLMLKGMVHRRDWTADLGALPHRTDIFIWNGVDYSLDWEKAQVVSLKRSTMQSRLKPGAGYARIARFRALEAVRIQNLFASNLTRVGVAVSFHHSAEVGLEFWAKGKEVPQRLFAAAVEEKVAALIDGRMLKPPVEDQGEKKTESGRVLVFDRAFPERFAAALKEADYSGVAGNLAQQLQAFADGTEVLNVLRAPHPLKKPLSLGPSIKATIQSTPLPDKWKGPATFVVSFAKDPLNP